MMRAGKPGVKRFPSLRSSEAALRPCSVSGCQGCFSLQGTHEHVLILTLHNEQWCIIEAITILTGLLLRRHFPHSLIHSTHA